MGNVGRSEGTESTKARGIMSRSGYSDEYECDYPNAIYLYRQAVDCAIVGKRGQKLFRDVVDALDALPYKRLAVGSFQRTDGEVCTLGALGCARELDMNDLNRYAQEAMDDEWLAENVRNAAAEAFDIAPVLAAEVMYHNDEVEGRFYGAAETPEERWIRMRCWVASQIRATEQLVDI